MYLILCRSSIFLFSFILNTLIFTHDNYIWKKNQCIPRPITLAIVYSRVEHDLVYHIVKCVLSYYIMQQI